jgi:hypothetical protein
MGRAMQAARALFVFPTPLGSGAHRILSLPDLASGVHLG